MFVLILLLFTFLYIHKKKICAHVWFVERKFSKFKTFFCLCVCFWISEAIFIYHDSSISLLHSVQRRERGRKKQRDIKLVRRNRNSSKNEFQEFRNKIEREKAITLLWLQHLVGNFSSSSLIPFTHDTAIQFGNVIHFLSNKPNKKKTYTRYFRS